MHGVPGVTARGLSAKRLYVGPLLADISTGGAPLGSGRFWDHASGQEGGGRGHCCEHGTADRLSSGEFFFLNAHGKSIGSPENGPESGSLATPFADGGQIIHPSTFLGKIPSLVVRYLVSHEKADHFPQRGPRARIVLDGIRPGYEENGNSSQEVARSLTKQ